MDAKHPCPDSALLAAFVDGTLEDYERTAVVSHLAECHSCRAAAVMVVEFQEVLERDHLFEPPARVNSSPAMPVRKFQTRGRWAVNRTAVLRWSAPRAAALAVIVLPLVLQQSNVHKPALVRQLANAAGSEHLLAARLSGGFQYSPYPASYDRDPSTRGHWQLVSTAAQVRASYEDDPATSSRQAVGVAALLVGHFDDAIASLSMAAETAPNDAHVLNDLAGAYYERSQRANRADDLPRALTAAEDAIAASPNLSEAWFNRALIITALGLRAEARQAWAKYLEHDSMSPWAVEARARLSALSQATSGDRWLDLRQRLETRIDQHAADTAVRRYASRAREYLDRDVWPAWAAAIETGAATDRLLERARLISDAFARIAGDRIYVDALDVIERAQRGDNSAALIEIAAAHRDFAEGLRLFKDTQFAAAAPILRRAEAGLRKAGSPLALRVGIEVAGTDYYARRYEEAHAPLAAIKLAARSSGYGSCLARTAQLRGLIAFARYDFGEVRLGYEEMLEAATATGDLEQQAFAHVLLANLHRMLGDPSSAWQHRLAAAAGAPNLDDNPALAASLLMSAAGDASDGGHHAAALVFQSALLGAGLPLAPAAELMALAQRARTLHRLGRQGEALDDSRLAREGLSKVSDHSLYGRVEMEVLAADAEIFRHSDPPRAVAAAERALTLPVVRADPLRVARFNLALAETTMRQGALDRADWAIRQGIAALEGFRALPLAQTNLGTSDPSWSLFVKAMQLALLRGDTAGAFQYSERRRIQTAFEQHGWGNEVLSVADVQQRVPADTALVVLNQLDDQLQVWVIRRDRTRTHAVSMGAGRANVLVASHLREVTRGTPGPRASAELFDEIVRPVLPALVGMRNVVVVADAPYHKVAFAGLWDQKRNRYLIEDHAIVAAPSATAYAWSLDRSRTLGARESRAVVVFESPDSGSGITSGPSLSGERGLASIYPRTDLRLGDAATAAGFLDEASRREVVHVAAPVAANGEYPFFSRLLLADAPGRKYSGAVFAGQVADAGLLHTRLFALDARGEHTATSGELGTAGITRALLAAGVPNIVGPVVDVRASGIDHTWLDFHRHYAGGLPVAESLRQAQLVALTESNHRPGPWAMLTVFGSTE